MYTVKSISNCGEYYLVKNWEKEKAFWKLGSEIKPEQMYKTEAAAKASITKLLRVMEEYRKDNLTIVGTDADNKIISETPYEYVPRKEDLPPKYIDPAGHRMTVNGEEIHFGFDRKSRVILFGGTMEIEFPEKVRIKEVKEYIKENFIQIKQEQQTAFYKAWGFYD